MNFGSIAYLNNGKLFIPEYLLRPFSIDNNTDLTLLSYSTPTKEDLEEKETLKKIGYKNLPIHNDILISPIPYRFWPFLIRVRVLLQERKGAIAALTNYFKKMDLNMLTADCHRAGFRYMVYSCFLECSEMESIKKLKKKQKLDWEEIDKEVLNKISELTNVLTIYEPKEIIGTKKNSDDVGAAVSLKESELKKLLTPYNPENKQEEEVQKFLFIPTIYEYNEGMKQLIRKATTLPYHHKLTIERNKEIEEKGKIEAGRKAHFAKYIDGSIRLPESLLAELSRLQKIDLLSEKYNPTFGFVNVDTNAPRIRVTLAKRAELSNFKRIIIDYRRDTIGEDRSQSQSTKGLVAKTTEILTHKFELNLENVVNRIWVNKREVELGKLEIIAEMVRSNYTWKEIQSTLERDLIKHSNLNNSETKVKCTSINPYRFFISLKTKDEKFVNSTKYLLYEAGKFFGIERDDFKFVWTHSSPVTESVINGLKECDALIQIYHSNLTLKDDDFTWLDGEFLAMRALDKPCARVCSDIRYFQNSFSKFDKDVMPAVINFSHGDKEIIENYKALIEELISRIDENEPNVLNRWFK